MKTKIVLKPFTVSYWSRQAVLVYAKNHLEALANAKKIVPSGCDFRVRRCK